MKTERFEFTARAGLKELVREAVEQGDNWRSISHFTEEAVREKLAREGAAAPRETSAR